MPKNKMLRIRVTNDQFERIKNNTDVYGYSTISSYIRSLSLERNLLIENKIIENNKLIKEILIKIGSEREK